MTSIETLWNALRKGVELGGGRRVDELHPADLYAALDAAGRAGLVLVTSARPPSPPPFEAVEVTVNERADGRWALGVWLRSDALSSLFARLCDDLVESSRGIPPAGAAGYILSRLVRWRRLLETGDSAVLGTTELRGLMGELIVLQRCLDLWPAAEVVHNWVGPLDAPQDFTLSLLRIEAKTIRPGAGSVRISSADQLDVADAALLLSVVTLASVSHGGDGISVATLVAQIRERLVHDGPAGLLAEFDSRLAAAGYLDVPEYEQRTFRVEALRFFEVHGTFPRLRRSDLPYGVVHAAYEISLSVCAPFETDLTR